MTPLQPLLSTACLTTALLGTAASGQQSEHSAPHQLQEEQLQEEQLKEQAREQEIEERILEHMEEYERLQQERAQEQAQEELRERESRVIGPPRGPIVRGQMRRYEYNVKVWIGYLFSEDPYNQNESIQIQCNSTQLILPVVMDGSFHSVNPDSIKVSGMIGNAWQTSDLPWTLRGPHPDGTAEIVLEFPAIDTDAIGMTVHWKVEAWEPQVKDKEAGRLPWPEKWPKEAEKFLKQSSYIDSTSETVLDFVRGITNDRQREVPIYLAAKEIIRHAVTHFFDVNGGRHSSLSISGNGTVIRNGQGSRGDMTCLAVGCLRAAGIPARPVLGLGEVWNNAEAMFEKRPILWGEFYLPGCGWIFFDPFKMRGTGIKWKSLDVPWEWFGTENDHAERTPLAYRLERPGNPSGRFCAAVDGLDRSSMWGEDGTAIVDFSTYRWSVGMWGWMVENCNTFGCNERRMKSITQINRTGSLFD